MAGAHIHLPVLVDGERVNSPDELKVYIVKKPDRQRGTPTTLYTLYRRMRREEYKDSFIEYVDNWCRTYKIPNPFHITPLNTNSGSWSQRVREALDDSTIDSIIANISQIAMSDNKQSVHAAEVLANWLGASKKIEVDAKADVDARVNLNPELFDIPDGK